VRRIIRAVAQFPLADFRQTCCMSPEYPAYEISGRAEPGSVQGKIDGKHCVSETRRKIISKKHRLFFPFAKFESLPM
jgi:hypothetical protein